MKKIGIFLFFMGFFIFACKPSSEKAPPDYNILLIVSDALRADTLGCYGGQAETPHINRLAEQGVLFENAYTNAPWTLPSSVAMFAGNYPSTYGQSVGKVIDSVVEKMFYIINDNEFLLAEELSARGYAAFYSFENDISLRSNILQGMVDLGERVVPDTEQEQKVIVSLGMEGMEASPRYRKNIPLLHYLKHTENPFFIIKWIADPHSAYSPPHKFRKKIAVDTSKLTRDIGFYERLGASNPNMGIIDIQEIGPTLNEHELQYVKQLYLKEIESVDERIGQILSALESNPDFEKTIVIFTSDHGEGFGEHGKFFHGEVYYEELVHVPLIISGPGVIKGKRIAALVSHVDLMPTLSEWLQAECMLDAQGKSYLSGMLGEENLPDDRWVYLIGGGTNAFSDALRYKNFKFIFRKGDDVELYDLLQDPGERTDISGREQARVREFLALLSKTRQENGVRKMQNMQSIDEAILKRVSQETIEKMRTLGYIK